MNDRLTAATRGVETPTRCRALIGAPRAELSADPAGVRPVFGGALDLGTWEVMGSEETDAIFDRWRRMYDPSGADYEWREITIELDTTVLRAMLIPATIPAIVYDAEGAG